MSRKRSFILSIGGFDPSGGAGVLADIKTFEQHRLIGMAVNTANTVQTEDRFDSVNWLSEKEILAQLDLLLKQYTFEYVKIGLVPSINFIQTLAERLKGSKIIWDPILSASAGFSMNHSLDTLEETLKIVYFVTPNWNEASALTGLSDSREAGKHLSQFCNVYLKGGHNTEAPGKDFIYFGKKEFALNPKNRRVNEKHGSGCILSSALASNLTLRYPIKKACLRTKKYVTEVLESNTSLLGYHKR